MTVEDKARVPSAKEQKSTLTGVGETTRDERDKYRQKVRLFNEIKTVMSRLGTGVTHMQIDVITRRRIITSPRLQW
ncbi:hypothetical protein [Pseudomonas psychrophila]|uniref:Uncharacterized protein n=1 Tax=Pseudomonas psychrophila TaxID=122355 RepID=A0A8I1FTT2_9PSED|nr:hypothetical protein [Pseudomonas psychrophila]